MNCCKSKPKSMSHSKKDGTDMSLEPFLWARENESIRIRKELEDRIHGAFDKGDTKEFERLLGNVDWNTIDKFELFPWREIYRAARDGSRNEFIKALIETRFDVNSIEKKNGKAAIHYAVKFGRLSFLEFIVNMEADVNLQDSDGNTPLHFILKKCSPAICGENCTCHPDCFKYLTTLPQVDCDLSDKGGFTPIHFASTNMDKQIAKQYIDLLLPRIHELNLDVIQVNEETARGSLTKYPELQKHLPEPRVITEEQTRLFGLLENKFYDEFIAEFTRIKNEGNYKGFLTCWKPCESKTTGKCDVNFTYLQSACDTGTKDVVELLLDCGADVNVAPEGTKTPIELACKLGQSEILELLLKKRNARFTTSKGEMTILHMAVRKAAESHGHRKCLELLLDRTDIDLNAKDHLERTALGYAVLRQDEESILLLLNHGARIDIPDCFGRKPVSSISYSTFKKFLNSKITTRGQIPKGKKFAIQFNYENFLREVGTMDRVRPKLVEKETDCPELLKKRTLYDFPTEVLNDINETKELRRLLAHPLLSCIIFFKWYRLRWLFFINFFTYFLFCAVFTTYTLLDIPESRFSIYVATWVLYASLVLNETMQVASEPLLYWRSRDSDLRLVVIVLATIDLALDCGCGTTKLCQHISAIAILFVWLELFFILGKWPALTFYVNIFVKSFTVLIKFLIIHVPVLIGFGFSFHILFGGKERMREVDSEASHFFNVFNALFKTLVMLTGEYNASDLHDSFAKVPVTSHIIFVAFICVISIVLVNLLIGLANNATRDVEDNPHLHKCIAQIWIITSLEKAYFNEANCVQKVIHKLFGGRFWLKTFNRLDGKTECISNLSVTVFPNAKNRIENFFLFSFRRTHGSFIKTFQDKTRVKFLDNQVAMEAQQIAAKHFNKKNKFNQKTKKMEGEIKRLIATFAKNGKLEQ